MSRRSAFPLLRENPSLIYLDSAATAHKPDAVIDALSRFYRSEYATVHRAVYQSAMKATEKYCLARQCVAQFLHAEYVEEIVFTRGTTDALNLVAQSYGRTFLEPGDEILLSQMEHHSNIVPWQMIAKEKGVHIRWIPLSSEGHLDWESAFTPRTKLVAVTHVSNVTGTINPIEQICTKAHEIGAVVVVDGAQAVAHQEVDVQKLGADFYAFSGHKCYGPSGVGVLYGKKHLLEKMPPIQGGGDMIEEVFLEESSYQPPPLRFEAGTPLIGPVIGLQAALEFLKPRLKEAFLYEHQLTGMAQEALASIEGVRILGPSSPRAPLFSFTVEGVHPFDLATWLDLKGIAVRSGHLCAQPLLRSCGLESAVRISFGLYNESSDINAFSEAMNLALGELLG